MNSAVFGYLFYMRICFIYVHVSICYYLTKRSCRGTLDWCSRFALKLKETHQSERRNMTTTNYTRLINQSKIQRPDYRTDMFGKKQHFPSHIMDEIEERKRTEGTKNGLCTVCFMYKASNGSCNCT